MLSRWLLQLLAHIQGFNDTGYKYLQPPKIALAYQKYRWLLQLASIHWGEITCVYQYLQHSKNWQVYIRWLLKIITKNCWWLHVSTTLTKISGAHKNYRCLSQLSREYFHLAEICRCLAGHYFSTLYTSYKYLQPPKSTGGYYSWCSLNYRCLSAVKGTQENNCRWLTKLLLAISVQKLQGAMSIYSPPTELLDTSHWRNYRCLQIYRCTLKVDKDIYRLWDTNSKHSRWLQAFITLAKIEGSQQNYHSCLGYSSE